MKQRKGYYWQVPGDLPTVPSWAAFLNVGSELFEAGESGCSQDGPPSFGGGLFSNSFGFTMKISY